MRHIQRLIAASVFFALCGTLAGCAGTSASSFDPMEMLDFLDQKKPLQGTRKPVFPDGVPGVSQGVPKELYKGNQQSLQQDVPPVTSPPPAPEPKARRGKQSPPAQPEASSPDVDTPVEDAAPAAPPPPKPAKRKRTSPTAIPRDDAAPAAVAPAQQQPEPQQQPAPQQQMSPFPAPMPSGSFQR